MIMACFCNFMVELYSNITFNGLIDFSAPDWCNKLPISLFLTSKLAMLMIYGFPKPWKPVFIYFIIPKIPHGILESIWEHPGTYYFCKYETQQISKKIWKTVCLGYHVFFWIYEYLILYVKIIIYFKNNLVEMRTGRW